VVYAKSAQRMISVGRYFAILILAKGWFNRVVKQSSYVEISRLLR
jgi:hypothetical protein